MTDMLLVLLLLLLPGGKVVGGFFYALARFRSVSIASVAPELLFT